MNVHAIKMGRVNDSRAADKYSMNGLEECVPGPFRSVHSYFGKSRPLFLMNKNRFLIKQDARQMVTD